MQKTVMLLNMGKLQMSLFTHSVLGLCGDEQKIES